LTVVIKQHNGYRRINAPWFAEPLVPMIHARYRVSIPMIAPWPWHPIDGLPGEEV
jgi:hypothetical protein